MRLLGVERGGEIVEQLRELTAAGIEVHTQVVLCPEWNDGAHLQRTIEELWDLGPNVLSLSVVPVGLTQYNLGRPVRLLTAAEARSAIAQVDAARERSMRERGTGWAYTGDEMYFIADLPIPDAAYYDDWPLTENGVGAVRRLIDDFDAGVDTLGRMDGHRIGIVTGMRMAPVLEPLGAELARCTGANVNVIGVRNDYFGETVTTAGLLAGQDIRATLAAAGSFDVVLLPAESLNDDDLFIDSMPLADLADAVAPARLVPAHEITSALGAS